MIKPPCFSQTGRKSGLHLPVTLVVVVVLEVREPPAVVLWWAGICLVVIAVVVVGLWPASVATNPVVVVVDMLVVWRLPTAVEELLLFLLTVM